MNIVYIAKGSYKSFYLNYFLKLKKCDLLIFNFDIIYDYNTCEELLGDGIVTKELMHLSRSLKCFVIAGVNLVYGNKKQKAFLSCNGEKINVSKTKSGIKVVLKNKTFIVGDNQTNYFNYNKIVLTNNRIYPKIQNCLFDRIYMFCDKFGVTFIENKKLIRKFNKYSKIILK